jgi:hypothetical protein
MTAIDRGASSALTRSVISLDSLRSVLRQQTEAQCELYVL